LDKKLFGR
jgi:hypothetical protein